MGPDLEEFFLFADHFLACGNHVLSKQGPVVQRSITCSTKPGLNSNPGFIFFYFVQDHLLYSF